MFNLKLEINRLEKFQFTTNNHKILKKSKQQRHLISKNDI